MIAAQIITFGICAVLFSAALYLLIWGDNPEPPTWESYFNKGKKYWRKK